MDGEFTENVFDCICDYLVDEAVRDHERLRLVVTTVIDLFKLSLSTQDKEKAFSQQERLLKLLSYCLSPPLCKISKSLKELGLFFINEGGLKYLFIPLLSPFFLGSELVDGDLDTGDEDGSIQEYFFCILFSLLTNLSDDATCVRRITSKITENSFVKLRRIFEIREYNRNLLQEKMAKLQYEDPTIDASLLDQGSFVLQLIDCSLLLLISHNDHDSTHSEEPPSKQPRHTNVILEAVALLMQEGSHQVGVDL
ncbi:hypothetical protein DI09_145p10 [Mitosporidium daphniae]|uniref:Beta-catenin-like protein 1 N-terminal domain-containing protein n=1 Tax=Mitosporidium daphniae TaxID=1485682 RepID=A0A098VY17_9MICR|nr:uncharacterized protein DI09_145p10 [Mitosporidium daphniae]KGG52671.1 hypothetical protein DI09_145p10 [Mitosporidium daphniae]|eukprot:XP_013239107.1 uncharacterized protein DI09_145p10 [Mitosporidium daphniae]